MYLQQVAGARQARSVPAAVFVVTLILSSVALADDWSGSYSSDDLTLVLSADSRARGQYSGTITLNGQSMPARGNFDPARGFHGTFEAGGEQFPFSLRVTGQSALLTSAGSEYHLKRKIPGSAPGADRNPLDRGSDARRPAQPPAQAGARHDPQLPPFLKPGMRITFHTGGSNLSGAKLVPNANGTLNFGGDKYNLEGTHQSGGVGYLQLNIVHASPDFVAADARNFLNVDAQNDIHIVSEPAALIGDAAALGEYWVNPARLAQLRDGRQGTTTTSRQQYTLNGRTYNAISIYTQNPGQFITHTYDLETGILLSGGTMHSERGINVVDDRGNVQSEHRGNVAMTHMRFVGIRETRIPWAGGQAPKWSTQGARLDYQGLNSVETPNNGLPPLPGQQVAMWLSIERVEQGCAIAKVTVRPDLGQGIPPLDSHLTRCFGTTMFGGLWLPADAVRGLEPNQVLDEDPITRFRTIFAGVQGNLAVFVEQGPRNVVEYFYDLQSGVLTASRVTTEEPQVGLRRSEFRLVGQK